MKRIFGPVFATVNVVLFLIKGLFGVLGITAVLHSSGVGILTGVGYIAGTFGVISTVLAWLLWWPVLAIMFVLALLFASTDSDETGKDK